MSGSCFFLKKVKHLNRTRFVFPLTVIFFLFAAIQSFSDTAIGRIIVTPADSGIWISAYYSDDTDSNNSLRIFWKLSTDAAWPEIPQHTLQHGQSPYIRKITGLTNGTSYDVRVVFDDSPVTGTNPSDFIGIIPSTLMHNSENTTLSEMKWQSQGWGVPGGKYGQFECGTCHQRNSTNIKRVKEEIAAPADSFPGSVVSFQTMSGFGDDSDGHIASTRVCEICHSQTSYHRYNTTGQTNTSHNNDSDCTICHKHSGGFKPSCNGCHGFPPATNYASAPNGLVWNPAPTGSSTGVSHVKHAGGGTNYSFSCETCHYNGMPATPIYDNKIQLGFNLFGGAISNAGTAYSGQTLTNNYSYEFTNGTIQGGDQNQCSNVYCHGNYPGSGKNSTPVWGGSVACGICHGASDSDVPGNTGTGTGSGSHLKHASNYTDLGYKGKKYPCTTCHSATVSGTLNSYTTDKSAHVNGFADVKFDSADSLISLTPAASYSIPAGTVPPSDGTARSYGTCQIYCHSNVQGQNGQGTPSTYTSPVWGAPLQSTMKLKCDACHYAVWHPEAQQTDNGSHSKHLSAMFPQSAQMPSNSDLQEMVNYGYCLTCHSSFSCDDCHNDSSGIHKNGIVNMGFVNSIGPFRQGSNSTYDDTSGGLPGAGFSTCTNMYCHSDGTSIATGIIPDNTTQEWGTNADLTCSSCHGYPPEYANGSPKKNSHAEHSAFSCDKCHYKVTNDGINISGAAYHANMSASSVPGYSGTPYYVDPAPVVTFTYSFATSGGACADISCHNNSSATWGTSLSPIIPSGAVAYWKLDETTGTTANDSIGANDGTVSGATWTAGKVNDGLSFNGNDNFVSVPDNSALNPSGDQTIEFWINFNSLPTVNKDIIQKGLSTGDTQFYIRTNGSNGMDFASCNISRCYNLSPAYIDLGISAGSWYHVAFVVDDSTQTGIVYVNGAVKANASAASTSRTANSAPLTLGGAGEGYFSGLIDEVVIYNTALTEEWVKSRYYSGDTSAPSVTAFAASNSASLTIPISVFTAVDDVQITGYMISRTADKPLSTASGWTPAAPSAYTVPADGTYTLYPWAKDGAGKVSAAFASPPTVIADTSIPSIIATLPAGGATSQANGTITMIWTENIDCASVGNPGNVTINAGALTLLGCSNNHAVFSTSGQSVSTTYTVTVTSEVADAAGNHMSGNYVFSYTTTTPDILPWGAVAYWKFDEGLGQTAADSVGPHMGILGSAAASDENDPAWITPGYSGKALNFDSAEKYLIADGSSALNAANLTLDAWVNAEACAGSNTRGANNNIIISRQQAGGSAVSGTPVNGYELGVTHEGNPYLTFEDISVNLWTKLSSTTPPTADSGTPSTLGRVPLGSSGHGDDYGVYSPTVIKDGPLYKMWYSGRHYVGGTAYYRIFYATSPDGVNWTKLNNAVSDPLDSGQTSSDGRVPLGSFSRADSSTLLSPVVIKDGSLYKMWYTTGSGVLYAESPDGLAWTKYDNAVKSLRCDSYVTHDRPCAPEIKGQMTRGTNTGYQGSTRGDNQSIDSISVIKDGQTYKMWYAGTAAGGGRGIYYATSSDGLTWTKYDNTISAPSDTTGTNGRIPIGINGGDSYKFNVKVIKDGLVYKMWYAAVNSTYGNSAMYYATSPDGLNWTKYDNTQPAYSSTTSSNGRLSLFGQGYMGGFAVIKDGSTYRAWYCVVDYYGSGIAVVYYATLDAGITATTPLTDGWRRLLATKNTGTISLYADGSLIAEKNVPVQSISNSANVLIGDMFNGVIDEVKVFKSDILDTTGPTIAGTTPLSGTTNVALDSDVTITWSENVDCSTVNTANITSTSPGWTFASCSFNQAVFHTSGQAFFTNYSVTVGTSVKDVAGNSMASSAAFSYTTPVLPAPPNFNQLYSPAPTSMTSYFYDNSNNEDDFRLHDGSDTVMAIVPSTTQTQTGGLYSYTETNLSPNTQYTRHIHSHNAAGDGSPSSSLSNYTQAATPNVNALPRAAGTWYNAPDFTFTNGSGWGQGGVQYYCYNWNQSSTKTWSTCTGSNSWSSGTLTQTAASSGSWYLHVLSYNANNYYGSFASSQMVFGPFNYDITAPSAGSLNPANGAIDVAVNSALSLTLSDANGGIDWNTFAITLTGSISGTHSYTSADTSIVSKTGTSPANYNVTVRPDYTFGSQEIINVTIAVNDLAGNSIASSPTWSFATGLLP